MTTVDAQAVADRIGEVRALIAARATRPVRLVAVTKTFGPPAVLAALAAGVDDIGESYAQELETTRAAVLEQTVDADLRWHFIGHLQRNKVRRIADAVDLWQSVDSERLGREIATRAPGARVLVQVNLAGTDGQGGVAAADTAPTVDALRDLGLDVRGLMMIGVLGDLDATALLFRRLRSMADDLELPECSMGMSADLGAALDAGTTMIRLGTALFGPR